MAKEVNKATQELAAAVIKHPRILYEEIMKGNEHTGSITLPIVEGSDKGTIVTIPFLLTNDFSFSLGNEWGTLLPPDITGLTGSATGWYNALTGFDSRKEKPEINSQISFQNKLVSILNYKGSKKPTFSVDLMFVCTQRNYNPSEIIRILSAMCLPLHFDEAHAQTLMRLKNDTTKSIKDFTDEYLNDLSNNKDLGNAAKWMSRTYNNVRNAVTTGLDELKSKQGFIGTAVATAMEGAETILNMGGEFIKNIEDSVMMAPLYYQAYYDSQNRTTKNRGGTVTLQIGNWFKADNLVCKSITGITFSKEIVAPPPEWVGRPVSNSIYQAPSDDKSWGFPLYAKCNVTLEPTSIINYIDFCKYFLLSNTEGKQSYTPPVEEGLSSKLLANMPANISSSNILRGLG